MHRLPAAIQGFQRLSGQMGPQETKKVLERALKQLKARPAMKDRRSEHLRGIVQGVQREHFHTGGRYPASGRSLFGQAYEPWSEDMACILQGSCLPGSTKYCRTKSMFEKLDMTDIMQGTAQSRAMSTVHFPTLPNSRGLHTLASSKRGMERDVLETSGLVRAPRIPDVLQTSRSRGGIFHRQPHVGIGAVGLFDIIQRRPQRFYSTQPSSDASDQPPASTAKLSQREKLKQAVKDYGSTVIVFHISISLMSLGAFYLAVSSGLDVQSLLTTVGFSSDFVSSRIASGTSTFLLSYAIYKVFAPVRIATTLACTPFIVRYLRGIGFLKMKVAPISK